MNEFYVRIEDRVFLDMRLSDKAVRLFGVLRSYCRCGTECSPSSETLAAALGIGDRRVRQLLEELVAVGLVEVRGARAARSLVLGPAPGTGSVASGSQPAAGTRPEAQLPPSGSQASGFPEARFPENHKEYNHKSSSSKAAAATLPDGKTVTWADLRRAAQGRVAIEIVEGAQVRRRASLERSIMHRHIDELAVGDDADFRRSLSYMDQVEAQEAERARTRSQEAAAAQEAARQAEEAEARRAQLVEQLDELDEGTRAEIHRAARARLSALMRRQLDSGNELALRRFMDECLVLVEGGGAVHVDANAILEDLGRPA